MAPARLRPADEPAGGDEDLLAGIPDILRFSTEDEDGADEAEVRVPLFSVNGNIYTMPAYPSMIIGIQAQRYLGDTSLPVAIAGARATNHVLTEMLGEDGYDALLTIKKLKPKAFNKIVAILTARAYGAIEGETPKAT